MPKLTNRWAVLALIVVARFSMALQFQSIPPLAPFLMRDLALTYGELGTLVGLFMLPGCFLAIPGGMLGQRFGDKRVTVAGLLLLTLGAALLAQAGSFGFAATARVVGGLGILLLNIESTKITTDWFAGKEMSTALGIMLAGWPLGIATALSSLGSVATASSWQGAVYLTAAATGVMALAFVFFYADPPAPERSAAPGKAAGPSAGRGGAASGFAWRISRRELILISALGTLWMLINGSFVVFLSFTPALLISNGATIAAAGLLVGLASWTSIAAVPAGGWIADRFGRLNLLIVGGAAVAALSIALVLTGQAVALWMVLHGLAAGLWASAVLTLAGQVLAPESRHSGFGVYYTLFYGGLAVLPPVAGWLRDVTGRAETPVLFAAGVMALGIPALLIFRWLERSIALPAASR